MDMQQIIECVPNFSEGRTLLAEKSIRLYRTIEAIKIKLIICEESDG
jgi:glutamate formiminotransferase